VCCAEGCKRYLHAEAARFLRTHNLTYSTEDLKSKATKEMKQAEVLIEVGDHIVKHGCIKGALARMMVSDIMSEEELQRTNVFCHHYLSDTYTFASRALKTVFAV
jgi:hypothetical protein